MMPLQRLLPSWPAYHDRLMTLGPMGYTLALNVRYLTPQIYVSTFPDSWVTEYTKGRYVLLDPVALWCAANTGNIRWSEMSVTALAASKRGVMSRAARVGLNFGAVTSQRNRDLNSQRCALSVNQLQSVALAAKREFLMRTGRAGARKAFMAAMMEGFSDEELRAAFVASRKERCGEIEPKKAG